MAEGETSELLDPGSESLGEYSRWRAYELARIGIALTFDAVLAVWWLAIEAGLSWAFSYAEKNGIHGQFLSAYHLLASAAIFGIFALFIFSDVIREGRRFLRGAKE